MNTHNSVNHRQLYAKSWSSSAAPDHAGEWLSERYMACDARLAAQHVDLISIKFLGRKHSGYLSQPGAKSSRILESFLVADVTDAQLARKFEVEVLSQLQVHCPHLEDIYKGGDFELHDHSAKNATTVDTPGRVVSDVRQTREADGSNTEPTSRDTNI